MKKKYIFSIFLLLSLIILSSLIFFRYSDNEFQVVGGGGLCGDNTCDSKERANLKLCSIDCENINFKENIEINYSNKNGKIRNLLGVNNGPLVVDEINCGDQVKDLSEEYNNLGIGYVRIHDSKEGENGGAADIATIFPDLSKNPFDSNNYDFASTDKAIKAIVDTGAKVIFRLGNSPCTPRVCPMNFVWNKSECEDDWNLSGCEVIEEKLTKFTYFDDFQKIAVIAKHIVAHYNGGWANGFNYDIKYWEIWNEPDVPGYWRHSPEEYFELFHLVSDELKLYAKESHSQLKVGGPAVSGIIDDENAFHKQFIKYMKENDVEFDFLSWHAYGPIPESFSRNAKSVRSELDNYGFYDVENIITEWNLPNAWMLPGLDDNEGWQKLEERIGLDFVDEARKIRKISEKFVEPGVNPYKFSISAPFIVSSFINLQDTDVDIATYYRGDTHMYGLFEENGDYSYGAYAFKAIKNIIDETPNRLSIANITNIDTHVLSGISDDGKTTSVLVSNFGVEEFDYDINLINLPIETNEYTIEHYIIDKNHNLELVEEKNMDYFNQILISEKFESMSVHLFFIRFENLDI